MIFSTVSTGTIKNLKKMKKNEDFFWFDISHEKFANFPFLHYCSHYSLWNLRHIWLRCSFMQIESDHLWAEIFGVWMQMRSQLQTHLYVCLWSFPLSTSLTFKSGYFKDKKLIFLWQTSDLKISKNDSFQSDKLAEKPMSEKNNSRKVWV